MIHQGVKILLTEQGYKAEGFPYTMDSLEKLKRELDWIAAGKSNAWVIVGGRNRLTKYRWTQKLPSPEAGGG